jgi:hypothetical protein
LTWNVIIATVNLGLKRGQKMKSKIYCLGGLIMDKKVFEKMRPEGIELVQIEYDLPMNHESLKEYAERLFDKLKLPENYQLLGVSFGGMIATEFSKIRKPEKLYLVSSISKLTDVPIKFRLAGFLKMHRMIPTVLLNSSDALSRYLFGVRKKKDLERIKRLISPKDLEFLKWALDSILNWKNTETPEAIRIHGTMDRILPCNRDVDYPIADGSHFIIANRSEEIARILSSNNGEQKNG